MDLPIANDSQQSTVPQIDMSVFEATPVGSTTTPNGGTPTQSQEQQEVASRIINVDEDFKGLPVHEAVHRTWQRKHDLEMQGMTKVQKEAAENLQYRTLIEDLSTDDETLYAYLNERKPDLLPKQELTDRIQAELKKEFGEYVPTNDEPRTPGSKAWLFDKRATDIYGKISTTQTKFGSLKELREAKNKQQQEQQAAVQAEMSALAKDMNWDEAGLKNFAGWASQLKPKDLAKIYSFALRTGQMRVPSAAGATGDTTGGMSKSRADFLNSL